MLYGWKGAGAVTDSNDQGVSVQSKEGWRGSGGSSSGGGGVDGSNAASVTDGGDVDVDGNGCDDAVKTIIAIVDSEMVCYF